MKIVTIERLIDAGEFSQSAEWKKLEGHLMQAIKTVVWPPGSESFTIYPERGKKRGEGNGVKPIKEACMIHLDEEGWDLEVPFPIAARKRPGKIDAAYPVGDRFFCAEWETGNISSTHRALNKMAYGIKLKVLIGGALILPTRALYRYLTDRVGNYEEMEPYFPFWQSYPVEEGLLLVIAIEHDGVSQTVPRIKKGTDGRALA